MRNKGGIALRRALSLVLTLAPWPAAAAPRTGLSLHPAQSECGASAAALRHALLLSNSSSQAMHGSLVHPVRFRGRTGPLKRYRATVATSSSHQLRASRRNPFATPRAVRDGGLTDLQPDRRGKNGLRSRNPETVVASEAAALPAQPLLP